MILFLDFDGVMHPAPPYNTAADYIFCRQPLLEGWLRLHPAVDIVISSSWREVYPFDEIVGYFSDDLQGRIVGATPILKLGQWGEKGVESPPTRFGREMEIAMWLDQSAEPSCEWAALDDQAGLFRPFNSHLVLCDEKIGLTQRELDLVASILGQQPDAATSSSRAHAE